MTAPLFSSVPLPQEFQRAGARRDRAREIALQPVLALVLAHVPLGLLLAQAPALAAVHAYACLAVGLVWGASSTKPARVANLAAYIAGAEVLWRMTRAPIFWEYGKYAVVVVLLLAIQRTRPLRKTYFPLVFLALLAPSALLTISDVGFERARQELSFNLSGPLALAVCVAFFSRARFTRPQLQRMLVAFLAPVVAVVAVTLFRMSLVERVAFTGESSKLTSGGFGPNQVSSVLGCAALMAFWLSTAVSAAKRRALRWLAIALMLAFAAQAALTLSRSGVYLAVGSVLIGSSLMVRDRRARTMTLITLAALYLVAEYVVLPRLDAFTRGAITKRFSDTGLTGRDELMRADIDLWLKNPVLGVGPGMAKAHRAEFFRATAAHTEMTRILAEHGLLGLAALACLLLAAGAAIRRQQQLRSRAFAASMVAFALLYMLANAMRLVLPSFTFGLAFARFEK